MTLWLLCLEKAVTLHSSTLAWRIPGTAEPGGLPSAGSHRVGMRVSCMLRKCIEFLEEKMERRGRKGGRKKGNTSHNEFLSFARN